MANPLRILNLEDNRIDTELIREMLHQEGFQFELVPAATQREFQQALDSSDFDLIVSDFTLPSYHGTAALELAHEKRPDIPFIFFSGTIGEETAVETLKNGATDYVLKTKPQKLVSSIRRALKEVEDRRLREEAEQRYRSIFEHAIEGICQTTPEGRFITANPALVEMLGYTSSEELFREVADFRKQILTDPEKRSEFKQVIERDGILRDFECQACKRDGNEIWISINGRLIRNCDGQGRYYDCSVTDVTERKRSQERIREQAALLDEAHDAICVTDMRRRILYWNRGAERLYRWSRFEALGRPIDQLLHRERDPLPAELQTRLLESGRWESELTQATKTGEEVIVESRWTLLREANGTPKSILIISADITEKKRTAEQFLRAQRMESIGALASGIAHDLNNVLAPVLMAADILKSELQGEAAIQVVEIMRASAQRGAEMVKQILSFARGVSGKPLVFNPRHLVQDVAKMLQATLPRSINVRTHVAEDLEHITGNVTQIHQVLMNLCVNARDAMPEGGILRLEAENVHLTEKRTTARREPVSGRFVVFSVADSGQGIPDPLIEKIFEPFFTTKEEGRGTGLGLATVRSIAQSHGGFVEVSSEPGKGSVFRVFLPATLSEQGSSRPTHRDEIPTGNRELILVVDDEAALLEISKLNLEAYNYVVLTARNGAEALTLFQSRSQEIKLVITDLAMPVLDGASLGKALREIDPNVRVILASGMTSRSRVSAVEKLPVQAFLSKPYTTETLLRTVASVLHGLKSG